MAPAVSVMAADGGAMPCWTADQKPHQPEALAVPVLREGSSYMVRQSTLLRCQQPTTTEAAGSMLR
eukprot:scaffold631662_cov39-Prasinocladus_malaysianus.AAC.1